MGINSGFKELMLFGAALYSNLLHKLQVVEFVRSLKNRQLLWNGKDHF